MGKWSPAVLLLTLTVLARADCPPPAPCYTEAGIVNGASFVAGSLAPNTLASIYGSDLAWTPRPLVAEDILGGRLPVSLGGVTVHVGAYQAPLYYVSPTQINVLIPANLRPGEHVIRVVRDGWAGPAARIRLSDVAPALFLFDEHTPVATRPDFSVITPDSPAAAGEYVILWATGLGETVPYVRSYDELPLSAAPLARRNEFQVLVDGQAVDSSRIDYAGVAPGFGGLYQINFRLPETLSANPEVRIALGTSFSPSGIRLPAGGYSLNFSSRAVRSRPVGTVSGPYNSGRRAQIHIWPVLWGSREASRSAITMSSPALFVSARTRP